LDFSDLKKKVSSFRAKNNMNAFDDDFSLRTHPELFVRTAEFGCDPPDDKRGAWGYSLMVLCMFLSITVHAGVLLVLDLRPVDEDWTSHILTVEIVAPLSGIRPLQQPEEPVPEMESEVQAEPVRIAATCPPAVPESKSMVRPPKTRTVTSRKKSVKKSVKKSSDMCKPEVSEKSAVPSVQLSPGPSPAESVPVGRLEQKPGMTVLANESGEDTLKHGAEARFMHGIATEEFVEENYVGEYKLSDSSRVWIEDDRAHSGHLILHAEAMGLHRKLFRFNRFIYVYGYSPDTPEPVLGTVTFFSDGYRIHQFLWQHNSTKAYYPRRD
jgi:hypothetical protein